MIHNPGLEDHSCTGMFVITEIVHTKGDNGKFSVAVKCFEVGDEDQKRFRLAEAGNIPYCNQA